MKRVASVAAIALGFSVVFIVVQNVLVARELENLPRLTTDFSATYLGREVRTLASGRAPTLVLGDSVLWGYRIEPQQSAVSLLRAGGTRWENLAFKGSSPPNYYALLRVALAAGVRPAALVLEVDDKVFNPEDAAYRTLNPSLAALAEPLLSDADRRALQVTPPPRTPWSVLEPALAATWLTYGMRADLRETLLGDVDAAPQQPATADLYEGTFDLTPLDEHNVGVQYLEKTVDVARAHAIPTLAFLTPANHKLLHEYIDSPEYRANLTYLREALQRRGVRVIDLDARFDAGEFIDESHLTPPGQVRLASILAAARAATLAPGSGRLPREQGRHAAHDRHHEHQRVGGFGGNDGGRLIGQHAR